MAALYREQEAFSFSMASYKIIVSGAYAGPTGAGFS
jgi:hypothetical protein